MGDQYIKYCMEQVTFWEKMLEKALKPKQDDIIAEIDQVLRTRSTEKLHDLYNHLKKLLEDKTITDKQYTDYLKYISTSKVA